MLIIITVSYSDETEPSVCSEECSLTGVCSYTLCKCCSNCTNECLCLSSKKDPNIKMLEILNISESLLRYIKLYIYTSIRLHFFQGGFVKV